MHKIKVFFAVLLTIAVVTACALFPSFIAAMQDDFQQDEITVGNVNAVKLEVKKIGMFSKLFLFGKGQFIDITTDKTRYSSDEIKSIVMEQIMPYVEAGLIAENPENFEIGCVPMLYYEVDIADMSNIFWSVMIFWGDEEYQMIELIVDDDTGKIITIKYECSEPRFEGEAIIYTLQGFHDIYFERINEGEEETVSPIGMPDYIEDFEAASARFGWGDMLYGEINMEFNVNPYGFHNCCTLAKQVDAVFEKY